ncbi:hypothetical protein SLITO_v1c07210 [Spiroplasma litorale]|uniref:Uncharacterized protein n=1 Tax=Spiroplasma litorale TaxID=216942 RepID=A0A0K1W2E4_9MOLU|nr:hypothetical protein [Spiroplasma litorale]AKX34346.1 hypothetical protein SLITO_v1c07210 [Spiroplasma litorale]
MKTQLINKVSFRDLFNYIFKAIFKTSKMYIFSIIMPTFAGVSLFLIKTKFGNVDYSERMGEVLTLFIVPFTFSLFTLSFIISNFESSILLKQTKIFSISKWKIYLSILICGVIVSLISFFTFIISLLIVEQFLIYKNTLHVFNNLSDLFMVDKTVGEGFLFFFSIVMSINTYLFYMICLLLISYILCTLIKSQYVIQGINTIIVITFLILGDCALNGNYTVDTIINAAFNAAGYFFPIKAFQWLALSLLTNVTSYDYNILQIIDNPKLEVPFTFFTNNSKIVLPVSFVMSSIWIVLFGVGARFAYMRSIK